jgi:hypothetical protein
MTIEIDKPELEALIPGQIRQGQNVEDILMRAYRLPNSERETQRPDWRSMRGMARGEAESLTEAPMNERASDNAHDDARIQNR